MQAVVPPPLPGDRLRRAAAFVLAAYLGLFLADGLCSVADDLLARAGVHAFTAFRNGVAGACVDASLAIVLLSLATPVLPKRVVGPPAAFALLCALVPPLLREPLAPAAGAVLDAVQVALAAVAWIDAWGGWRPVPLAERLAGRPFFTWRNLLAGAALALFVGAPLLALWTVVAVARAVEAKDGGFMLFHWDRLEMRTKRYVRSDGKEIDLVPMIHIGEGEFYGKVAASFPPDTIVLTEGITDRTKQAPRLDYTPVATALGLRSQSREFGRELAKRTRAEIRSADIDYADFSPDTRAFIASAARFVARPSAAAYVAFEQEWGPRVQADPGFQKRVFREILDRRNAHVLQEAAVALGETGRVVLPWGALHMPGLERGVLEMGFRPAETRSLDAIRYGTLLRRKPAQTP